MNVKVGDLFIDKRTGKVYVATKISLPSVQSPDYNIWELTPVGGDLYKHYRYEGDVDSIYRRIVNAAKIWKELNEN